MTKTPHEARRWKIARIVDPEAFKLRKAVSKRRPDVFNPSQLGKQIVALAKADAILADDPALVLVEALEGIREYWNRDTNHDAMHDACWHAINTAEDALTAYQSTDKGDAS